MIRKIILLLLVGLVFAMLVNAPVFGAGGGKSPPTLSNPTFADVTQTTATLGGTIDTQGSSAVTDRGVEWGTAPGTYPNSVTEGGTALGEFTVGVTGLPSGVPIYFRAWAINVDNRTGYTAESSFPTLPSTTAPTLDASTLSSLAAATSSTATLGGNITSTGGDSITDHGTVWNTTGDPITQNASNEGAVGATIPPDHSFSSLRSGLPTGTQIHFRSYATNLAVGTGYGPDNSFYTEPANSPAFATIDTVTDSSFHITWPTTIPAGDGDGVIVLVSTSAVTGTGLTDGTEHAFNTDFSVASGGADLGALDYAVYRGAADNITVTGLSSATDYFVGVFYYAGSGTGESGINYKETAPATDTATTTAPAVIPEVDVATPASITTNSAILGGDVTNNGGGLITAHGIWWDTDTPPEAAGTQVQIDPAGDDPFSQLVGGLPAGDEIFVRAYAVNSAGTGWSTITSFNTLIAVPTVTADPASSISATSATLGGTITDGGCDPVPGCITARGTVWNTTGDPNIVTDIDRTLAEGGTSVGVPFSHERTGLPTGQLVYFRTYATNSAGTGYSAVRTFTPSAPPQVSTPTHTNENYFSAVLGGTVDNDGGNPIIARGTVWDTSPGVDLTNNPLAEGGTAVGDFTHTRFLSGTPPITIYYKAYATSSSGTGYSPEASFLLPTEPDIQASLITFPRIASQSLRISWVRGNGEGSIVVIREGTDPIGFHPADGVDYAANPDFLVAPDLGSGHKVVYQGPNNVVVVTGLTPNTWYSVAVYEYAYTAPNTDYLLGPAEASTPTNDTPVHNLDNNVDCDLCHAHSKSATFVPHGADVKLVCEFCHQTGQVAAGKVQFDNHLTPTKNPAIDYVDCGSCHELHNQDSSNTTLTTHWDGVSGTQHNKSYLRANVDKYVPTASPPAVFHTDNPGHADPPNLADTPDRAEEGGTRGFCQVCHTLTNYHRNVDSVDSNQCHDGEGRVEPCTNANPETHCGACHEHNNKFIGTGGSVSCIECHNSSQDTQDTAEPPYVRPQIVQTTPGTQPDTPGSQDGQFDRASKHIIPGTPNPADAPTPEDCEVCHDQGSHKGGMVTLKDLDGGPSVQAGQYVSLSIPGAGEPMEVHCLSCHGDGTPTAPFANSVNPPPIVHAITTEVELGVFQPGWDLAGHNKDPNGDNPPTNNPVTCMGDGNTGCHASGHGSESVSLLANAANLDLPEPISPAEGSAVNPTDFCFNCHDSDGPSSKDIEASFPAGITGNTVNCDPDPNDGTVTGTGLPCNFQTTSGSGAPVNQRHDILAEDQTYSGGAVSCANCHAPHADNSANPVADVDTGNQLPNYNYTNYAAAGDADPSFGVIQPDYIQFCLACHDGPGNEPAGVVMDAGMVDISSSYVANDHHGAVQGGGSGNGYLKPPYDGSDSVTYAAMNCTDCHGAHGSPNIFNLKSQITIGGTVMTVGGWTGDGVGEVIGDGPPGAEQTVYYLPRMDGRNAVDASGVQEDHQWGAWCSFCHQMQSHGRDETVTCTAGHMHGDGKM